MTVSRTVDGFIRRNYRMSKRTDAAVGTRGAGGRGRTVETAFFAGPGITGGERIALVTTAGTDAALNGFGDGLLFLQGAHLALIVGG
jgi:hypothetical protein